MYVVANIKWQECCAAELLNVFSWWVIPKERVLWSCQFSTFRRICNIHRHACAPINVINTLKCYKWENLRHIWLTPGYNLLISKKETYISWLMLRSCWNMLFFHDGQIFWKKIWRCVVITFKRNCNIYWHTYAPVNVIHNCKCYKWKNNSSSMFGISLYCIDMKENLQITPHIYLQQCC